MRNGRILVATRSAGKLRELYPILEAAGFSPTDVGTEGIPESPAEDAVEAFGTFEENAAAKAWYFFQLSGLPSIADDSGLEVAALGGAPGVRSKRWSERRDLNGAALDAANNELLLERLGDAADRRARYVCAAAYVDGVTAVTTRGEVNGVILRTPLGTGGFGYDPCFFADELGRTFAQSTIEEKERVSHRGRAVRALLERVRGDR